MRRLVVILAVLLANAALAAPAAAQCWINDRRQLSYQANCDPDRMEVEEWQIRLYRRGARTGGNDHWGLITGDTAAQVTRTLEREQAFERRYERWSGTSSRFTYFNHLGPIAVLKQEKPVSKKVIDRVADITKLLQSMYQLHSVVSGFGPDKNPFKLAGIPASEYLRTYQDAVANHAKVRDLLSSGLPMASLERQLDDIQRQLEQASAKSERFSAALGKHEAIDNVSKSRAGEPQLSDVQFTLDKYEFQYKKGTIKHNMTGGEFYEETIERPYFNIVYHIAVNFKIDDVIGGGNAYFVDYGTWEGTWEVRLGCLYTKCIKFRQINNDNKTDVVSEYRAHFGSQAEAERFAKAFDRLRAAPSASSHSNSGRGQPGEQKKAAFSGLKELPSAADAKARLKQLQDERDRLIAEFNREAQDLDRQAASLEADEGQVQEQQAAVNREIRDFRERQAACRTAECTQSLASQRQNLEAQRREADTATSTYEARVRAYNQAVSRHEAKAAQVEALKSEIATAKKELAIVTATGK